MLKITPIGWSRPPSLWHKVEMYFHTNEVGWLKYLQDNPYKNCINLDQKKDSSCPVFATAWMVMWNTPIKFTNEDIRQMAVETWYDRMWGTLWKMCQLMAQSYNLSYTAFPSLFDKQAQFVLDKWYALACSTRFGTPFYKDGLVDWKVDSEYTDKSPFLHDMFIEKSNGKYYFHNSWGWYIEKGYHNKYEVSMEMMERLLKLKVRAYFVA